MISFENIRKTLKSIWLGFFVGMKNTEDATLHQTGLDGGAEVGAHQEVNEHRVSKALLKGELTQEVKELRHRTYAVDREAKNYEYYTPNLALKKSENDSKFVKYDDSDGLELITLQPNREIPLSVYDMIEDVDVTEKDVDKKTGEINVNIGKLKHNHTHTISIEREKGFTPRYRAEDYIKLLTVKKDGEKAVLGLYFTIYPNDKDFKSKGFIREIEHVMNNNIKSDVFDFKTLSFVTNHAYRIQDMVKFVFVNMVLRDIKEFDGHYVVSFYADFAVNGEDTSECFRDEIMERKYTNHESKNATIDLDLSSVGRVRDYICEECGKKVFYNVDEIDAIPMTDGREIDSEQGTTNTTAALDVEVSEQTFGKRLCRECMQKKMSLLLERKLASLDAE